MRRLLPVLAILALLGGAAWWALVDPRSPLPAAWNPFAGYDPRDPPGPFTAMRLSRAAAEPVACAAALDLVATFDPLPPLDGEGACDVPHRVGLRSVGEAAIRLETSCAAALRLAVWARHAAQPAAAAIAGAPISAIRHQGSYACRAVRGGTRPSTHSTAEAIDIRAVVVAGREVPLLGAWDDPGPDGRLWRALHAGACEWFVTVLGPDFDANHADHLHAQSRGWGLCR
ncbi:extensin family protein [Jannaschia sp. Os4]|uniref:extensin-like domain-containing protein n=1 Tax=Jannaschia sp. Os4 TaxID=2807617 RepID=UPI0019398BC8|nr:extensin family protein [Jannaschia sp. Os4]MBM2575843.1 extensin family protein [Jannaschia sp. Os4]